MLDQNGWDRLIFQSLTYIASVIKTYSKIQYRKPFNLHKITYFIVAFFVSAMNEVFDKSDLAHYKNGPHSISLLVKTIIISFIVKIVELSTLHILVYFILFSDAASVMKRRNNKK